MVKENAYSAVTADDAAEVREALLSAALSEEDGTGRGTCWTSR
jgi:hypothetical protein